MNKHRALALAATAAISLAGCGITAQPAATAPTGDNRPATSAPAEAGPEDGAPAPTSPQGTGVQAFGSTYVYDDGLAVTISSPQPYEPSEYAAGTDGFTHFIVVDVTVVNQTGAPWDPALFYSTLQSANQEASEVFDSPTLSGPPSTTLLDGREAVFQIGFGVADPADLVLEVTPDFSHEPLIYQQGS